MAAPASLYEAKPLYDDETYARSLSTLERVGALAVAGALESGNEGVVQLLRDDFETGVLENLLTAPDVDAHLDVERVRTHQIVDGHAVAADGTPMVEIIERGYQKALATCESDDRMRRQARRDEGDCLIARQADALQPGRLLLAVSLPPLEGLAAEPKFWKDLGYRPDLSYIQTYYKTEEGTMLLAGSFSVDTCDIDGWRQTLAQYGIDVPVTASADDFIRSSGVFTVSAEVAREFGYQVRENYYRTVGMPQRRQSVSEYLGMQSGMVQQYINHYLLPLAEAVHTGKNVPTLQGFANALLNAPIMDRFNAEVSREVMKVANRRDFPRSAGPVMENLIRYALVERLRSGLIAVVRGAALRSVQMSIPEDLPYKIMHRQLANDVTSGVSAGRNYGGCASLALDSGSTGERTNPQEAYGGRSGESKENWQWKPGTCRFKSVTTIHHDSFVGPCDVCRSCQRLYDTGHDPAKMASMSVAKRIDHAVSLAGLLSRQPAKSQSGLAVKLEARSNAQRQPGLLALAA